MFTFFIANISVSCNSEYTNKEPLPQKSSVTENQQPKPVAQKVVAKTSLFFKGEFTEENAMTLLYGNYNIKKGFSIWKPSPKEEPFFRTKLSVNNSLYTSAAFIHEFTIDTIPVIIILTETSHRDNKGFPDDCHACAPILGAALFAKIKDTWCLQNFEKNLGEYGYWGILPKANFVKYGQNNYGIIFEINDGNQGTNFGGMDILGIVNDKFRFIGSFQTWFNSEASWTESVRYSYESDFSIIPDPNKGYYDISIKTYGTKPYEDKFNKKKKNKTLPFHENRVFSFIDSVYVLTSYSTFESPEIKRKGVVPLK